MSLVPPGLEPLPILNKKLDLVVQGTYAADRPSVLVKSSLMSLQPALILWKSNIELDARLPTPRKNRLVRLAALVAEKLIRSQREDGAMRQRELAIVAVVIVAAIGAVNSPVTTREVIGLLMIVMLTTGLVIAAIIPTVKIMAEPMLDPSLRKETRGVILETTLEMILEMILAATLGKMILRAVTEATEAIAGVTLGTILGTTLGIIPEMTLVVT